MLASDQGYPTIYVNEPCLHKLLAPGWDPPVGSETECIYCGAIFVLEWVKVGTPIPNVKATYALNKEDNIHFPSNG